MRALRLAIRSLRATPIVSIVAALSLALGIGANTSIFSLVNSLLLRELPVKQPQQLAIVSDVQGPGAFLGAPSWTYAIWQQIRQRARLFDGALASSTGRFNLATA